MIRIGDQPVLLADTGPFCRCAEAGPDQLAAAVAYLRPNTRIVQDVARELARRAKSDEHARLASMAWHDFPTGDPITITDGRLLAQIDDILNGRRRHRPGHFLEDRGEVATILVAKRLGCAVLIDETWGRRFAERKGLQVFTTQDLAAELASARALTEPQAWEIFRRVFTGSRRAALRAQIAALESAAR